jgi:hypothetical protein
LAKAISSIKTPSVKVCVNITACAGLARGRGEATA